MPPKIDFTIHTRTVGTCVVVMRICRWQSLVMCPSRNCPHQHHWILNPTPLVCNSSPTVSKTLILWFKWSLFTFKKSLFIAVYSTSNKVSTRARSVPSKVDHSSRWVTSDQSSAHSMCDSNAMIADACGTAFSWGGAKAQQECSTRWTRGFSRRAGWSIWTWDCSSISYREKKALGRLLPMTLDCCVNTDLSKHHHKLPPKETTNAKYDVYQFHIELARYSRCPCVKSHNCNWHSANTSQMSENVQKAYQSMRQTNGTLRHNLGF